MVLYKSILIAHLFFTRKQVISIMNLFTVGYVFVLFYYMSEHENFKWIMSIAKPQTNYSSAALLIF